MKIKPDDYARLAQAIRGVYSKDTREQYRQRGLTDTRFYWDCLWESGFNITPLYSYLDDRHIGNALRSIVKGIENGVSGNRGCGK